MGYFDNTSTYYANVYDKAGAAVIIATPVTNAGIPSVLQIAYYEHGLVCPDYDVYLSSEAAETEAAKHPVPKKA